MSHSVYFGNGTNEPSMCTSEAVVRPNIKDKVRLDIFNNGNKINFRRRRMRERLKHIYIHVIAISNSAIQVPIAR